MSSTKRGTKRVELDQYPTPKWCVHRLLEAVDLPAGRWLEPCAGAGNIINAVSEVRSDVKWDAWEIDPKYKDSLHGRSEVVNTTIGDATMLGVPSAVGLMEPYSVIITRLLLTRPHRPARVAPRSGNPVDRRLCRREMQARLS